MRQFKKIPTPGIKKKRKQLIQSNINKRKDQKLQQDVSNQETDHVETLFNATTFPDLTPQQYTPPICIGVSSGSRPKISALTYKFGQFIPPVHDLALSRPVMLQHDYVSFLLGKMLPMEKVVNLRTEDRHQGPQTTITLGNYEGGRIWIEGEGTDPPPSLCLHSENDGDKLGTYTGTNKQWTTVPYGKAYCI